MLAHELCIVVFDYMVHCRGRKQTHKAHCRRTSLNRLHTKYIHIIISTARLNTWRTRARIRLLCFLFAPYIKARCSASARTLAHCDHVLHTHTHSHTGKHPICWRAKYNPYMHAAEQTLYTAQHKFCAPISFGVYAYSIGRGESVCLCTSRGRSSVCAHLRVSSAAQHTAQRRGNFGAPHGILLKIQCAAVARARDAGAISERARCQQARVRVHKRVNTYSRKPS